MIVDSIDHDLKSAVREALERKGVLKQLKSRLRAEVYHCLEDKSIKLPEKPPDVFLAVELIRDLLITLKLENTMSVFNEELGQPPQMICDRDFIGGELGFNVKEASSHAKQVPLLVQLVHHLKTNREQYLCDLQSSLEVNSDDDDINKNSKIENER